jgi:hypothetical protein
MLKYARKVMVTVTIDPSEDLDEDPEEHRFWLKQEDDPEAVPIGRGGKCED